MVAQKGSSNPTLVNVSPTAFAAMTLHAFQNPTTVIHGLLIGTQQHQSDDKIASITKAFAICHEVPTKPLVDTALALAQSLMDDNETILGWYEAPKEVTTTLEETSVNKTSTKPSAVANRLVASLDQQDAICAPILIVLQNQALVECIKSGGKSQSPEKPPLVAFGKDFSNQCWLEVLETNVISDKVMNATQVAYQEGDIQIHDLVHHFEQPKADSTLWLEYNDALEKHVAK